MRAVLAGFAIGVLVSSSAIAQPATLPPAVSAVQDYLLTQEYPEQFGETTYRMKITNAVVADLDGDRQAEVIVHFMPHYRQSPTIVIYRVSQDMKVIRVVEGLAPGPLVSLTGDHLDSHTLGEGVDISVGDEDGSQREFVDSALREFAGVVEYGNFLHVDSRKGAGVYIDMSDRKVPSGEKTCENFEFSALKEIAVGRVSGIDDGILLAAEVARQVYLYRIRSFRESGLLDKQMWTVDVGQDFGGLATVQAGALKYLSKSGETKTFEIQCAGAQCAQVVR